MKTRKLISLTAAISLILVTFLIVSFMEKPMNRDRQEFAILLITNDDLKPEWETFTTWKKRIGKPSKTITVSQINEIYEGADIQEKIRACCLEHINNQGVKWVILGGDSEGDAGIVPHRMTPHSAYGSRYFLPTDYYYISETDWDSNANGIFGEFKKDAQSISYTNDKAVIGRIPVRTKMDVKAYTDKVIAYESEYPEKDFATNMTYTCNVESAYAKLSTSTDIIKNECSNVTVSQFYDHETPWSKHTNGETGLTTDKWMNSINDQKNGKIHMHGHGLINLWVMNDGTHITANEVNKLTNKNAYPVITTVSCFTGEFDSYQDPSIVESMIRKENGGAILVLCPSRPGVPIFEDPNNDFNLMLTEGKMDATTTTMTKFWEYGQTNHITSGEALRMVKKEMSPLGEVYDRYHFVLCELNLLGDPSLELRSANPTKPKLEASVTKTDNGHEISVQSNPNATICVWKENEVYEIAKADESGVAKFSNLKLSKGKILVSASGYNYNANLSEIEVQ